MEQCEELIHRYLDIMLTVYVDDMSMITVGANSERVATQVARATRYARAYFATRLGARVNLKKSFVLASCPRLRRRLLMLLGTTAMQPANQTKSLGVGLSLSGPARAVIKGRLKAASARALRASRLRKAGAKASKVFTGNVLPAATYGIAVSGIPTQQLQDLRVSAARALANLAPHQCTSLTLRLAGGGRYDPLYECVLQPLRAWACAVWEGLVPIRELVG